MKLLALLAVLATVANAGVVIPRDDDAYCPQTSGSCDASEKPDKEIKGDLEVQLSDEVTCSGTVVVDNACSFTVKDFKLVLEKEHKDITWWASRVFNTGKGAGNQLSSDPVEAQSEAKDVTFTVNKDSGCWANMNSDVGTVYLMDGDKKVLCHANIRTDLKDDSNSGSNSGSSGGDDKNNSDTNTPAGGSTATPNPAGTATTTTKPAGATTTKATTSATNKPEPDGSSSRYLVSSTAIYLALIALTYLLN